MKDRIKFGLLNNASRLRKLIFGPHATGVTYQTENGLLALPIEDFAIGRKLGFTGRWDINEIHYLKTLLAPQDHLYVIGAHVGAVLIPLAQSCQRVICFEANPTTFEWLRINLLINRVGNVDSYPYAVGDRAGKLTFLQNKVNSGGSKMMPKVDSHAFRYDRPQEISVDMVPLDAFVAAEQLPRPDMLIIDIEGAEYLALQGMPQALSQCRHLYIEYEPHHLRHVAGCSVADFFGLLLDHFATVRFMRQARTFDLRQEREAFVRAAHDAYASNQADDLLFSKANSGGQ